MKERRSRRCRLILTALIGAAVLVVVVIALLARSSGGDDAQPTPPPSESSVSASPTSTAHGGDVVDPGVEKRGWVPEPITQDADVYVRAALEAAATFDTRRASRDEWLTWLGIWFTPSPLYDDPQDGSDQMAGYRAELAQSVVLPQSQWDDLARNDGYVSARLDGQIEYLDQPDAAQKHVRTATANVIMTYTQTGDGTGGEASYDQTVRVSVQVVCGGASIPTPDSAQRAGDCKVVRFFDAAVG
jgi:hypothetical protein